MQTLPPPLIDAARQLRDAASETTGGPCSLSLSLDDGSVLGCYPDGEVLLILGNGGSQVLRPGARSADIRTAARGAR